MEDFLKSPEWFGAAILGAIIAAAGYIAKVVIELVQNLIQHRRENRSRLIELRSLLRAARIAFRTQNKNARKLTASIQSNSNIENDEGLEMLISTSFDRMDRSQRELHSIIRGVSINALYPTNKAILEWLRADTYYKSRRGELAGQLSALEAHVILWLAKYESWIPNTPEHALVYLDDEKKHGLGFPKGLDVLVDQLTGYKWRKEKENEKEKEENEKEKEENEKEKEEKEKGKE